MMQTTLLRILRAVPYCNIVRRRVTQASLHKHVCHVHLIMALSLVNVWGCTSEIRYTKQHMHPECVSACNQVMSSGCQVLLVR